jgi:hypothetical protein
MNEIQSMPHRELAQWIYGVRGRVVICAGFLCFLLWALYPFDWDPPKRLQNGATFGVDRALSFAEPGLLIGKDTSSLLKSVRKSGALKLKLRVRSYEVEQDGPARIVTWSIDHHLRNMMVGQVADGLVVIVHTLPGAISPEPEFFVPGVFRQGDWADIEVILQKDRIEIKIDGRSMLLDDMPVENLFDTWRTWYVLYFGNELTGKRPWLGEIATATLQTDGKTIDLLDPSRVELNSTYWNARYAPSFVSMVTVGLKWELWLDYLLNFLGFIPLGFVLAARKGTRFGVLRAALYCGSASLGVEMLQIFFDNSFPSIYDWILNTGGASLGGFFGYRYSRITVS